MKNVKCDGIMREKNVVEEGEIVRRCIFGSRSFKTLELGQKHGGQEGQKCRCTLRGA